MAAASLIRELLVRAGAPRAVATDITIRQFVPHLELIQRVVFDAPSQSMRAEAHTIVQQLMTVADSADLLHRVESSGHLSLVSDSNSFLEALDDPLSADASFEVTAYFRTVRRIRDRCPTARIRAWYLPAHLWLWDFPPHSIMDKIAGGLLRDHALESRWQDTFMFPPTLFRAMMPRDVGTIARELCPRRCDRRVSIKWGNIPRSWTRAMRIVYLHDYLAPNGAYPHTINLTSLRAKIRGVNAATEIALTACLDYDDAGDMRKIRAIAKNQRAFADPNCAGPASGELPAWDDIGDEEAGFEMDELYELVADAATTAEEEADEPVSPNDEELLRMAKDFIAQMQENYDGFFDDDLWA